MSHIDKNCRKCAVAALAAVVLILPAMAGERQEKIFKVTGIPSVSVRNITGSIEVRT